MIRKTIPRFLPETRGTDIIKSLLSGKAGEVDPELRLKKQLIDLTDTNYAHLMPSARAGLYWLLRALKPPRLYLPAFLCSSIYECALRAGTPMTYLDCEEDSFTTCYDGIDYEPGSVLLLVHQYGIPSDPSKAHQIAGQNGLILVEDAASSLGARWKSRSIGSFGDATIISFEYSKTISACKGGALVYTQNRLADKVETCIRNESSKSLVKSNISWTYDALKGLLYELALMPLIYGTLTLPLFRVRHGGFVNRSQTFELDGPYSHAFGARRASLTTNILRRLPEIIEGRRKVFNIYRDILIDIAEITLPPIHPEADPVCTHFPILLPNGTREEIVHGLWAQGIDPGFNFSYLCGGRTTEDFAPVAHSHTQNVLTLPVSSRIKDNVALRIAKTLRSLVQKA
jgi:dTDP-4-amino-4,6-dideoxygalactose transaminase